MVMDMKREFMPLQEEVPAPGAEFSAPQQEISMPLAEIYAPAEEISRSQELEYAHTATEESSAKAAERAAEKRGQQKNFRKLQQMMALSAVTVSIVVADAVVPGLDILPKVFETAEQEIPVSDISEKLPTEEREETSVPVEIEKTYAECMEDIYVAILVRGQVPDGGYDTYADAIANLGKNSNDKVITSADGILVLPEGLTKVVAHAFEGESSIREVILPSTCKSIGANAFAGCTGLKTIQMSSSVKVAEGAFDDCPNLTIEYTEEVPESEWDDSAFTDEQYVECFEDIFRAIVAQGQTPDGGYDTYADAILRLPQSVTVAGKLIVPDGLTKIGDYVFSDCKTLTQVELPDSCKSIGLGAFSNCTGLESINLDKVETIGTAAFKGCSSLPKALVISASIESVDSGAFKDTGITEVIFESGRTVIPNDICNSIGDTLLQVTIPEGVERIEENAFSGCSSLKQVELPDSCKSLGTNAFSKCTGLESINLDKVEKIGAWAFDGCSSLPKTLVVPNSIEAVLSGAFADTGITEVIFESGRTAIPGNACSSIGDTLLQVTIPEGVESIGSSAFKGCSSLKQVVLPQSCTSIGAQVFQSCTALESINLDKIEKIGAGAFNGCSALPKTLVVSNSVWSVGSGAFKDTGITEVIFESGRTVIPNDICNSIGDTLLQVTIPEGVEGIAMQAFYSCDSLKQVVLPQSCQHIGEGAFKNCSSLVSINLDYVTEIRAHAFQGCTALSNSTVVPTTVERVWDNAFSGVPHIIYNGTLDTNLWGADSVN